MPRKSNVMTRETVNIIVSLLSIFSIVLISMELFMNMDSEIRAVLRVGDYFICSILLLDWVWRFVYVKAERFTVINFVDLIASLPTIEIARYGRFLRILRLFSVYKAHKGVLHIFGRKNRKENTLLFSVSLIIILQIVSAALILELEKKSGNIRTSSDAIWWAFVTMTTVGYGDYYPVTNAGRILAAVLMSSGIGFFSLVTGIISSWMTVQD